jgi:hypothetical protein
VLRFERRDGDAPGGGAQHLVAHLLERAHDRVAPSLRRCWSSGASRTARAEVLAALWHALRRLVLPAPPAGAGS